MPTQLGVKKLLALRPPNLRKAPERSKLEEDGEMLKLIENRQIWSAFMEVKSDPTKMRKYMDDPEIGPMLDLAAAKIGAYQKSCGGG